MKVFSGSANQRLAERIAKELRSPFSIPEKFIFPDGEERIRVLDRVLNEDAVLVQPLCPPVNENLIELCFIADALKRSGAKRVSAVIPYLGYQRQDRVFREGEAVSLLVVIKILEAVSVDRVLTFDLHSIKIPEFFHIPVSHLSALSLFGETIKRLRLLDGRTILVSPDMGGVRRVKMLSLMLGNVPFASVEKYRNLATGAVLAKKVNLPRQINSLKGKNAIVLDDMISGGGTIVKTVELLKKKGVSKIFVFATHPIFSQNAATLLKDLSIEKVYVTDTIFVPKEKRFPKLEILSVAGIIARELFEK